MTKDLPGYGRPMHRAITPKGSRSREDNWSVEKRAGGGLLGNGRNLRNRGQTG